MTRDVLTDLGDRQQRLRVAKQLFTEREQIEWLMRDPIGRQLVWRLFEKARVLAPSLLNSTATVQSAHIAVRDFVMEQLFLPILDECPRLFLQMKAEHDSAGPATNTN